MPSPSFLVSLGLMSPKQREEKVKKNHGVLTLRVDTTEWSCYGSIRFG